jgi:hypothetical protein
MYTMYMDMPCIHTWITWICHGQALLCLTSLDSRAEDLGRKVHFLRGLSGLAGCGLRAFAGGRRIVCRAEDLQELLGSPQRCFQHLQEGFCRPCTHDTRPSSDMQSVSSLLSFPREENRSTKNDLPRGRNCLAPLSAASSTPRKGLVGPALTTRAPRQTCRSKAL